MQAKQHISLLERTTSLCYCYSSLPHTFILIILYKTPRVSQTTSLPNKYLKGKVERSSRCSRAGQKSFLKNLHKIHFDFKYEVFLMDMSLVFFQGANRTRSERVPNAFGTLKKTERVRNAVIHFITLLLPSILLQKD